MLRELSDWNLVKERVAYTAETLVTRQGHEIEREVERAFLIYRRDVLVPFHVSTNTC